MASLITLDSVEFGEEVLVNLDHVVMINKEVNGEKGCCITLAQEKDPHFYVSESINEIYDKIAGVM